LRELFGKYVFRFKERSKTDTFERRMYYTLLKANQNLEEVIERLIDDPRWRGK
jgi:hypothetical protein